MFTLRISFIAMFFFTSFWAAPAFSGSAPKMGHCKAHDSKCASKKKKTLTKAKSKLRSKVAQTQVKAKLKSKAQSKSKFVAKKPAVKSAPRVVLASPVVPPAVYRPTPKMPSALAPNNAVLTRAKNCSEGKVCNDRCVSIDATCRAPVSAFAR